MSEPTENKKQGLEKLRVILNNHKDLNLLIAIILFFGLVGCNNQFSSDHFSIAEQRILDNGDIFYGLDKNSISVHWIPQSNSIIWKRSIFMDAVSTSIVFDYLQDHPEEMDLNINPYKVFVLQGGDGFLYLDYENSYHYYSLIDHSDTQLAGGNFSLFNPSGIIQFESYYCVEDSQVTIRNSDGIITEYTLECPTENCKFNSIISISNDNKEILVAMDCTDDSTRIGNIYKYILEEENYYLSDLLISLDNSGTTFAGFSQNNDYVFIHGRYGLLSLNLNTLCLSNPLTYEGYTILTSTFYWDSESDEIRFLVQENSKFSDYEMGLIFTNASSAVIQNWLSEENCLNK